MQRQCIWRTAIINSSIGHCLCRTLLWETHCAYSHRRDKEHESDWSNCSLELSTLSELHRYYCFKKKNKTQAPCSLLELDSISVGIQGIDTTEFAIPGCFGGMGHNNKTELGTPLHQAHPEEGITLTRLAQHLCSSHTSVGAFWHYYLI